nr:hypothetical protein [Tanacetum cinerariifolium]
MVAARFSIVHAPASNDRELPNTASKNGRPVGPTNRKRTLSASSSPPVTQRADRRPPKITYRQKNQYCPVVVANQLDRTLGDPHIAKLIHAKNLPLLGSIQSVVPTTKPNLDSFGDILLCQRILSALISEKGKDNENDDTESNGYGSTFEDKTSLKSNGFMEFRGVGPFYGYGKNSGRGFHIEPVCSVSDYQTMSMDNKLLMEIQSIRLCPELMVGAIFSNTLVGSGHGLKQLIFLQKVDDEIDGLISDLENKYHEQVSSKTSVLNTLLKTATEAKTLQEKKSSFADNESGQRCPQLIPFGKAISNGAKGKRSISSILNVEDDEPPLDFSHLEIPEMDVLGDAFGEQSLDVGSWLNIDDTILHDDDFIGH